jgi:hypothetical protein
MGQKEMAGAVRRMGNGESGCRRSQESSSSNGALDFELLDRYRFKLKLKLKLIPT